MRSTKGSERAGIRRTSREFRSPEGVEVAPATWIDDAPGDLGGKTQADRYLISYGTQGVHDAQLVQSQVGSQVGGHGLVQLESHGLQFGSH
jgi:hypothetical protein